MAARTRPARVADVHELALAMPHVTVWPGPRGNPIYQVGGKSFVFFRTPRPDAADPRTGERYPDVIMFWVGSEADKQALVQDEQSPFFTTPHFDGHPSVLIRGSRIGELTLEELTEIVQDAWLAQASARRAATWLSEHSPDNTGPDNTGPDNTGPADAEGRGGDGQRDRGHRQPEPAGPAGTNSSGVPHDCEAAAAGTTDVAPGFRSWLTARATAWTVSIP